MYKLRCDRDYLLAALQAGNILVDGNGVIKLGDFGVSACMFETWDRQRSRNTFAGTPCWCFSSQLFARNLWLHISTKEINLFLLIYIVFQNKKL